MNRRWRLYPFATVLAVLALVASSCGGGGSDSEDKDGSVVQPAASAGLNWLVLLQTVPDTADARSWVVMNDYAQLREQLGLQPPAQDAPDAEIMAYLEKLAFASTSPRVPSGLQPSEISGFGPRFNPGEWNRAFGFNLTNVDQDIDAGKPPHTYTALKGPLRQDAHRHGDRQRPFELSRSPDQGEARGRRPLHLG